MIYIMTLDCGHTSPLSEKTFRASGMPVHWWCGRCRKTVMPIKVEEAQSN